MSKITYDFTGENFIVTGASSGMGRKIVSDLVNSGAKVLAIARRTNNLESLKSELGDTLSIASVDVRNKELLENSIKCFVKANGKLKGAVHCAGIEGFTPLRNFDEDLARSIMDISFWGAIYLAQIVNKKTNSYEGCSTVIFSSVAAVTGKKGLFAYSSAKAAMNTATKTIAKEIAKDGKRINSVLPAWVVTEMTQNAARNVDIPEYLLAQHLMGLGEPSNVCNLVKFLLSDDSSWVTGTNIVVDGGYLAGAE